MDDRLAIAKTIKSYNLINNIMPKQTKLNPKQKLFVEVYLQSYNASEAARQAGYSESIGHRVNQSGHKPSIKKSQDR